MANEEVPTLVAPVGLAGGVAGGGVPFAVAVAALAAGASGMAASPIFVRLAEVGPFASAFWRMALAVPMLLCWLVYERALRPRARSSQMLHLDIALIIVLGVLFAGDLFFWHLAILNTSVANATLLATMAPIFVTLGAGLVLKEQVSPRILLGVVLGIAGAAAIVGRSARFDPQHLDGDLYGLITAFFFGAYLLAVSLARRRLTPAMVMFYPAVVAAVLLLIAALALDTGLLPHTWRGLAALIALAAVSQVGGQGLAAFALGHLPAIFSSLVIFFEAIVAASLGALIFAEAISVWQAAGGALILAGIWAARPRRRSGSQ